jgi:uncharacterized protein YjiS (DUF1127 family)
MAYVNETTTNTFSGRIGGLFDAIALRRKRSNVFRQTYNELVGLSDRELYDLGISRYDIRRLATEAAQNVH